MWIGTLALVGMPFFSGFYSKDTIIEAAAHHVHAAASGSATYGYWAVLLGVFVTSFYSFRLLYLTFHGKERFRHLRQRITPSAHDAHAMAMSDAHGACTTRMHDDHPRHGPVEPQESPLVVTVPLVLLAIPSVCIGFLTVGPMLFGDFFNGAIEVLPHHTTSMMALGEEFHGPGRLSRLHGFMRRRSGWPSPGSPLATYHLPVQSGWPSALADAVCAAGHAYSRTSTASTTCGSRALPAAALALGKFASGHAATPV